MDVLLVLAAFCGLLAIFHFCGEKGRYLYHRNPYRRMCANCGQVQENVCHTLETWDNDWWEETGEVTNPECNCHKDVR